MLGTMLYIILLPAMVIFTINANNSKYQRIYSGICTIVSLLAFVYLNTRGAWLALFPVLIKWEPHTRDFSRELGDQASQRI